MDNFFDFLWKGSNKLLSIPLISLLITTILGWRDGKKLRKENQLLTNGILKANRQLEEFGFTMKKQNNDIDFSITTATISNAKIEDALKDINSKVHWEMISFMHSINDIDPKDISAFLELYKNVIQNEDKVKIQLFIDRHIVTLKENGLFGFAKSKISELEEDYNTAYAILNDDIKNSVIKNSKNRYAVHLQLGNIALYKQANYEAAFCHLSDAKEIIKTEQVYDSLLVLFTQYLFDNDIYKNRLPDARVKYLSTNGIPKNIISQARTMYPDNIRFKAIEVYDACRSENYPEAEALASKIIFAEMDDFVAGILADCLSRIVVNSYNPANKYNPIEFLEYRLTRDPLNLYLKIKLGHIHFDLGNEEQAGIVASGIYNLFNIPPPLFTDLLELIVKLKKYEQGKVFIENNYSLAEKITSYFAANQIVELYYNLHEHNKVFYYGNKFLSLSNEHLMINYYVGLSYMQKHTSTDYDKAKYHLLKCSEHMHNNKLIPDCYYSLAKLYFYHLNELKEAKINCELAIAADKSNIKYHELRNIISFEQIKRAQ